MKLLNEYMNGNTKVSIYDDGTKVREYEGEPKPVQPESMDIKITNKCNGNCGFCHEMSHPNGEHADLDKLLEIIKPLKSGTELAVGGGAVLSHPALQPFLTELKARGMIANMTINQKHLGAGYEQLKNLLEQELIYGLGISYSDPKYFDDIAAILSLTNNAVFHVIMGLNKVDVVDDLNDFCKKQNKTCKILVLGYKQYGFGKDYYNSFKETVDNNKLRWYRQLACHFKDDNLVLSFDNLAIEQLKLRRFFTDEAWNKFYMGNEGIYSCYLDAVKQQYAICSVDPNRKSFDEVGLLEFFQNIRR